MARKPRRTRRGLVSWLPGLALAVAVGGGGTAWALWSAEGSTASLAAHKAVLGLAVTQDATHDAATSGADWASFTIGRAEAEALVAAGPDQTGLFSVSVAFDVSLLASAGYGMNYRIDVAQPDSGTVFGLPGTTWTVFPVGDPANCTVAAAGSATAYTLGDPVTGIAPGTSAPQTMTVHWCLVAGVAPAEYSNAASATGANVLGDPETSVADPGSTWGAYLLPDPAAEPALAVTVTPLPKAGAS